MKFRDRAILCTKIKHIITYIVIVSSIIFFAMASQLRIVILDNYLIDNSDPNSKLKSVFIYNNLIYATLLNFIAYELGIIFCKGIIFYIIIRDDEITTTKQVLMAITSLVPIFLGLFG